MPWRGPDYPGEVPTLGWLVLDWMAEWLVVPDGPKAGEPLILTPDQAQFILDFYAIDLATGKRLIRRGVLSRPKGYGKSPLLAGMSIAEAIAPVVPDGWDASGEPVGRPWTSLGFKAKAQILGVSEDATANTWDPVLDMIREGPLVDEPGVEAMETFVNVPRGRIEAVSSSAVSREGFRPIFAVMDQTESWTATNGGKKLAATVRRNLTKTGGSSVETPNSFRPGFDSVAEDSHKAWKLQQEGKTRNASGILFDHREAPADTDLTDRESMLEGLRFAYGCSAEAPCALAERGDHDSHEPGWVDLGRVLADFWDPATDPADGRMYFLNQITAASDAYLSQPEWAGCVDVEKVIADRDVVTLGFDGSRGRAKGKPDATALVGCRVEDGHLFEIAVWEADDKAPKDCNGQACGKCWVCWEPPLVEIEAAIADAFKRFSVAAFYADPAKDWRSHVNKWEAAYATKLVKSPKGKTVQAGQQHPFEWWMTGGRSGLIQRAVEQFEGAVRNQDMTHDGSYALTRHMLNARRRLAHGKLAIGKESDYSPKKVDAAVAAVLAWQARLDAVAAGIKTSRARQVPKRIR